MGDAGFEIIAKVPAGTSKAQFQEMKQNLLAERFKLALHWEPKERTVYELLVGKNGLRMRESVPDGPASGAELSMPPGTSIGPDRYPVFPKEAMGLAGINNYFRWRSANVTMADLVKVLRGQVRSDVVDATGLTGKYDIDINWQARPIEIFPASPPFDTPIEKVLQERLGLRLQSKKGMVSVPVIDHIEKIPTPN
jgi:uncharacterized protein (TIGR03435 family)